MIKRLAIATLLITCPAFAVSPHEGSASLNRWLGVNTRAVRWCGCYLAKIVAHPPKYPCSVDSWRRWGHPVSPRKGAVVIFKHRHVGKLISIKGKCVLVNSGNDGNAIKIRCRRASTIKQYRVK